jgi:predicted O-methyltransferase YrrM
MATKLQDFMVLLSSIKYPKETISSIYNRAIEKNAEFKRRDEILREVSLTDLIGDDFPSVFPYSFLNWGSGTTDIMLLNGLANRIPQCIYLEIGTWEGESICNVSRYAKECISISLSEEQIFKRYGEKYANVINHYCKKMDYKNIMLIGADSKTFDFNLLNKKFDLVFIDGDHSYSGIVNDTEKVFPYLRDKNSIIVWHDYAFEPEKIRFNTLDAILDAIPDKFHKYLYHVENTMCAILYFGEIKSKETETFPRIPTEVFEITIKIKK